MVREIRKVIKRRERRIKISLKEENKILKELCKYLFQLTGSSSDMFFYYSKKIDKLEKKLKK